MKIKLEIINNGKVELKEFSTDRMRGRALKRMLEVTEIMENASENEVFTKEHYDLMCEFICEMFGNKFSVDELLDGIEIEEIYPNFMELTKEIGNRTMQKMDNVIKK